MNSFSIARSEYSPLVRWLWNGVTSGQAADAAAVRHTLALLQRMGCHTALLDAPPGELPANIIRGSVDLWLTHKAPTQSSRQFIWYGTDEFSAAEAAAWCWPSNEPELISVIAVPLVGTQGSPDWSRAIALSPDAASLLPHDESFGDSDVRFYFWTQGSAPSSTLDLLNPDVLPQLAAKTQRFATEFPDSLRGILLDVTSANDSEETPVGFPWSAALPQQFLEQHGYDIRQRLVSLVANTGSDAARVRQHYWASATRICSGNIRQAPEITSATRTALGGAATDETLSSAVARCGDIVSLWREASIPAVNLASHHAQRDLMARLCASVAALHGHERCLAQTWRSFDWGATPAARLPIIHQLMHRGINSFVPAVARAELSSAIADTPSEAHQPFAGQWKHFAEYLARCSDALAQGRNGARIGLLWPVRSAWAHYNPNGHRFVRWVEEDLQATAQLLDELHFDFVLLPEDDLCAAPIEAESQTSTRLLCGKTQLPLEIIVLSSVTTLSRAAWDKLQDFIESGGKVAFFGLLPRWSELGRDTEFEERIGQATRLSAGDLYDAYAAREDEKRTVVDRADEYTTYPIAREYHSGGRLCCYQPRLEAMPTARACMCAAYSAKA
jgi:hypothetical protein